MKNLTDTQVYPKLIVITRRDLSPGYQAVQAAHAAIEFQHEYPEIAKEWNTYSKYLVFLSVENEEKLHRFLEKIKYRNIKHTIFIEPDIGDKLTAIALEPNDNSRRLTAHLPLALKELTNS